MIRITVYEKSGAISGFDVSGHAGYEQYGSDIVCAAVSALVTTCINSMESFTDATLDYRFQEESGDVSCRIVSGASDKTDLLLASMLLGLQGIEDHEEYEPYIDIIFKEV